MSQPDRKHSGAGRPRQSWLRRGVSILLQTNRPVPPRSDDEIAAEMERNYHWNFSFSLLDNTAFWFGISFISSNTIVPLFISKLTTSPLPIGLAAMIAQAGWFLPQIFTANIVERLPRRKPVAVNVGFFLERLPVWVLILAPLLATRSPALALLVFLFAYAWRGLGGGTVATAWQNLFARCFPVDRRGRLFGLGNFLGAIAGAAGAGLSTWLLQHLAFPTSFVYMFAIAAAGLSLSWLFMAQTREPAQPSRVPRQSHRQFLATLPGILRYDHNFRRFLVARSLIALGGMGMGFVTVSAIHRWQVPDATVGLYTAAYWVGQTIGTLTFGFLADRSGHKLCLELGTLSAVFGYALVWLAPSPAWMPAVFVLLGIGFGAMLVSGILVSLEFSEPERRPTYTGLANTIVGLSNMCAPLLGAWLAATGYGWVFGLGTAANLGGLVAMRWWVREPRWLAPRSISAIEQQSTGGGSVHPDIEP
jgi:MFS family permease